MLGVSQLPLLLGRMQRLVPLEPVATPASPLRGPDGFLAGFTRLSRGSRWHGVNIAQLAPPGERLIAASTGVRGQTITNPNIYHIKPASTPLEFI